MKTTVSGTRGTGKQHCGDGHEWSTGDAYEDAHGVWCKECGGNACSGPVATCTIHEHRVEIAYRTFDRHGAEKDQRRKVVRVDRLEAEVAKLEARGYEVIAYAKVNS